jgi:DNA-binding response OmpR family regulator
MAIAASIIVVDDEPDLREAVAEHLAAERHRVREARDGAALRSLWSEEAADLVILDIRMPGEDGLSLARWLRDQAGPGEGPAIIMLTAAGEVVDRVVGLELGADDYIVKPFDLRELSARIQAVLGRVRERRQIRIGRAWLDVARGRLQYEDGTSAELRPSELALLRAFLDRPGRMLTRDDLLDLAPAGEDEVFDRSIDMRISRLRQKIEADPREPSVIRTLRRAGYIFVPGG